MNLISNAAKFTPVGGAVVLEARAAASGGHTGIGIALEDQKKLFVYFEQVGGKHAHHMKGSGVGLALTRALVERQGGTITVRSTLGSGSAFDVHLPVAT
jgi:signal transduction histidine kinase